MTELDTHGIGDQQFGYRRGLVLGLTMAEVGILIIFVLLLLIAFAEQTRRANERVFAEAVPVPKSTFESLRAADSALVSMRSALGLRPEADIEEIQRLVRAQHAAVTGSEKWSVVEETKAALAELRRARDQLAGQTGSEQVALEVEKQSLRLANQEGQLKYYEKQLAGSGLGKGERPCWVQPDGIIDYLYRVSLENDGIRMHELDNRPRERSLLKMPNIDPLHALTPGQFRSLTRPLYDSSVALNCRFYVDVFDATGPAEKETYKRHLQIVEEHFYKRLSSGPPPF